MFVHKKPVQNIRKCGQTMNDRPINTSGATKRSNDFRERLSLFNQPFLFVSADTWPLFFCTNNSLFRKSYVRVTQQFYFIFFGLSMWASQIRLLTPNCTRLVTITQTKITWVLADLCEGLVNLSDHRQKCHLHCGDVLMQH